MLMLLFYVGKDIYALNTRQIVEVIPRVILRKVYHAPEYVAGMFNYRGVIVPAIDLSHLIHGESSRSHLSTRIIMVNYFTNNTKRYMGLMAERVTETLNIPEQSIKNDPIALNKNHHYLGEMIVEDKGIIQQINLDYFLSDSHQNYLIFAEGDSDNATQN